MGLLNNPAFVLYVLAATVVALHLLALAFYTAAVRGPTRITLNTEDASTVARGATVAEVESVVVARAQRVHRNALENAVPFLIIGLLYVLTGASARGAMIFFGVYVVTRILHSLAYLSAKQPWRTMMFATGALCSIGMSVQIIRAAVPHL